ncbi:unnamed protein product [Rotaria sp. Silwood1]|nr:unnamed protein product [Rotaria sp. Silwood1]CAF1303053.1 unnamed protein product [Rotaria sp. Silwood1]
MKNKYMNADNNDDDNEEDIILDRKTLNLKAKQTLSTSSSSPFGPNHLNIGVYDDSNKLSKIKTIILATTCISMGMFTGLLGPTFPYLAQKMSTKLSSIIWFIVVKGIGFLIGTCLSSYLYTWFNTCCLLGLSCLSISFGVYSLSSIIDLTTFYLISLTLGIGFGLTYNGIDALYNRVWIRPSISSIRWLHLLVALGAIISTLILLPSTFSIDKNLSSITNITQSIRPRRAIMNNTDLLFNQTISSTTINMITKSSKVVSENLISSFYTKSSFKIQQTISKSICIKSYCCYDQNKRNNIFICQKYINNQTNNCKNVFLSCETLNSTICYIDKIHTWCRIEQICENDTISNCSRELIDIAIHINNFTTIKSLSSTSTTNLPLTSTSTINITTSVPISITQTTVNNIYLNITQISTNRYNKPSMAESDKDDLSKNFFYLKIRLIFHSMTLIDLLYLCISLLFFLLGILYSILAMQNEKINLLSIKNLNPLSLLFIQPHRIINNLNKQISLLSDYSSFKFIFLLILFYFILSGIEHSCIYLIYLFGKNFHLSEYQCLLFQFYYLFGRLIDILINYIWFLLNKYFNKTQTDFISIKFLIFIRLIILTLICFFNLFHQIYYFVFFSIGFFLTSLSSLILYWIERDLSLNELLLRIILYTIIISEIIFPIFIFYNIEYFLQFYLLISLCLLTFFFMIIIYSSKKWQRNRSYRLLPESMDLDEIEFEENSDNET